jgi:dTDP-4-amino-4,6-dideoxygalactose transaminase
MKVPLLDLKLQYQSIKPEIDRAVSAVIENQMFILGSEVEHLEKEIAAYSHCTYGIGVTSGTDALLLALMALEIKPGDEIITTPYTFFATAGVIHRLGARPVFVDILPDTYNINPELIEKAVTPKTKAVIPVHLYGQCADMDAILKIAKKFNLAVIEDAAQAIGAEYKGKRAGSMGTIGCFSFFPSKNLGAFGDGGMVVTNNAELAEKMTLLRVHGMKPKYYHPMVGGNFRLDALQAAVLRVKLKYLDEWTKKRQENATVYSDYFTKSGLAKTHVKIPAVKENRHIFNQYIISVKNRDSLLNHLKSSDIGCEVYYPVPLHLQKCFSYLNYKKGDFPISEEAADHTLALPVFPELIKAQLDFVAETISSCFQA